MSQTANDGGKLIDADPDMEWAQLTALHNRQTVGGESPLDIGRTPQTLLSLFSQA